jgi:DNA (cytosine-5)-methyltransferase 1
MKYLDLFAGIGGFALGAYWAGIKFDGHYFSEIDKYAISVYQKRFPDAVFLGDIRKIHAMNVDREVQIGNEQYIPPGDWIISGGFPCQDISVAGKGAGLDGDRSGLWFEYARLISEVRPRFAIMENVGALTVRGLDPCSRDACRNRVRCSLAGYTGLRRGGAPPQGTNLDHCLPH